MKSEVALLILDMQNDIVAFDERDNHLQRVIETIAEMAKWAREANIPVIYSRVAFRPNYADLSPFMQIAQQHHLLDETSRGSAVIDELAPVDSDIVITKRRVGVFYNTDLEVILRNFGVRTLLFTGKSTSRVVESTVREARDRDFRTIVISDGCIAGTPEFHENALKSMADFFAEIMTAAEAKKELS